MSKKYRITVDGTAYTVEVEDLGAGAPAASAPVAAPAPAPVAAPALAAAPAAQSGADGRLMAVLAAAVAAAGIGGRITGVTVAGGSRARPARAAGWRSASLAEGIQSLSRDWK